MMTADWLTQPIAGVLDAQEALVDEYLKYADRVVRRGFICNTLGNIAVRIRHEKLPSGTGVLTKRRGVSLEEMCRTDLIVTDMSDKIIYVGEHPPSGGHALNQRLLRHNSETCAVIHTHPNEVIGLFSQLEIDDFDYVSVDTAIVLDGPPRIFAYGANPERDAAILSEEELDGTCFLMPNHGLTTVGQSLSQAYHRHTSMVAEAIRVMTALEVARGFGRPIKFVPYSETSQLYTMGSKFLYGSTSAPETDQSR